MVEVLRQISHIRIANGYSSWGYLRSLELLGTAVDSSVHFDAEVAQAGLTGRRNTSVSRQHQLSLTEGDGDGKAASQMTQRRNRSS